MTHTLQCAYYSKYRHKLNKLYLATLHWDLDVGTIFKYRMFSDNIKNEKKGKILVN